MFSALSLRSRRPIRRSDLAGVAVLMLVLGAIVLSTSGAHHVVEAIGVWIVAIGFLVASRMPSS